MFGGFLARTDYRDPFIEEEVNSNGWMIWPPIRYSYRTINKNPPSPAPSPPTWENPIGTDDQARDVLARVIYGFRISVLFGLILTLFSSIIGVLAGAVQGYFGGWTDLLFQRFIEIWGGLPMLYMLIILASVFEPSFWLLLCILLLFSWGSLTSVVRAEFLRTRNFDYVNSARALGVKDFSIMVKHILPNAMVASMTMLPFVLNGSITMLTSLDFLGFGLPPGSPSLGELLAQGKANLQAPWLVISGFVVLASMLSLLIFIGEAVRDAFDPKKDRDMTELLKIRDLSVSFHTPDGIVEAVKHADLTIEKGEMLSLVGESGSGKTVTGLSIPQLLPNTAFHPSGSVIYEGKELMGVPEPLLREIRGNKISMIFQEPMTSLNPLHTIERQISEILKVHRGLTPQESRKRCLEVLQMVGLSEAESRLKAYPHQLSGGQRQRVMIAIALANEPDLLIADEPTTALDVTIQAQILKLLKDLQKRLNMAVLLITHDLSVVGKISDRTAVMTKGENRRDRGCS